MTSHGSERNYGCRIDSFGTYKGMRTLILQNQTIRLSILLDKGSDIFELLYKPKDIDVLWRSPIGIRPPHSLPSIPHPQGVFMDHYHGGWQELFPSGSGPGFYQGAYLGYHGEVASCAWDYRILVDEPEVIEVLLTVKTLRTPFLLEKKIRLESGKSIIYLQEKITNYGKKGMHFMWGHHPSFGAPFLSEECTLALPPCKIIPLQKPGDNSRLSKAEEFDWPLGIDREGNQVDLRQIRGSEAACSDMLFATSYKEGWYALTNHRMGLGVGMVWPVEDFPHLWIWQDFGGTADYPWYGNAYTMAVEPFTSRVDRGDDGLNEAIRNGTAAWIGAGEETAKELKVVFYETTREVKKIEQSGEVVEK